MTARAPKRRVTATRARTRIARATPAARRWSQRVMRESDAMDLQPGVFTLRSAAAVARSLKRSVERSTRRKAPPFQSAMSMLNFEINRAGRSLPAARRQTLEAAKVELRRLFHREPAAPRPGLSKRKKQKKGPARSRRTGSGRGQ